MNNISKTHPLGVLEIHQDISVELTVMISTLPTGKKMTSYVTRHSTLFVAHTVLSNIYCIQDVKQHNQNRYDLTEVKVCSGAAYNHRLI